MIIYLVGNRDSSICHSVQSENFSAITFRTVKDDAMYDSNCNEKHSYIVESMATPI